MKYIRFGKWAPSDIHFSSEKGSRWWTPGRQRCTLESTLGHPELPSQSSHDADLGNLFPWLSFRIRIKRTLSVMCKCNVCAVQCGCLGLNQAGGERQRDAAWQLWRHQALRQWIANIWCPGLWLGTSCAWQLCWGYLCCKYNPVTSCLARPVLCTVSPPRAAVHTGRSDPG